MQQLNASTATLQMLPVTSMAKPHIDWQGASMQNMAWDMGMKILWQIKSKSALATDDAVMHEPTATIVRSNSQIAI